MFDQEIYLYIADFFLAFFHSVNYVYIYSEIIFPL